MKLDIEVDADDISKLWHTGHVGELSEVEHRLEVIKGFGCTLPDNERLSFMHIDGESNYLQALVVYHYYKQRDAATAIFWDISDGWGWVVATNDYEEITRFESP